MTKAELVAKISSQTGIEKKIVLTVIESFMANIKESLTDSRENIYLRGFGSFALKHRAAKTGRNITKNTTIDIPERYIPSFKPSKEFVQSVSAQGVD